MEETPLGWVEHRLAWGPRGEVGRWVMRNPAVAVVDGNLFVHGGISVEYSTRSVEEINRQVRAALANGDQSPASVINDQLGPLWYRGLALQRLRISLSEGLDPFGGRQQPLHFLEQHDGVGLRRLGIGQQHHVDADDGFRQRAKPGKPGIVDDQLQQGGTGGDTSTVQLVGRTAVFEEGLVQIEQPKPHLTQPPGSRRRQRGMRMRTVGLGSSVHAS